MDVFVALFLEAFRLALAAMCQAELTLGGEGCQGVPNLTVDISGYGSHYQVVSQTCSRIRFTFHFTICTKTKTNFEPSPNPGLVFFFLLPLFFIFFFFFFGPFGNVPKHDGDLPLTLKDSWWEGLDQISEKFSEMTDSVHIGEISGMHCLEQVNDHTCGLYTGTIN